LQAFATAFVVLLSLTGLLQAADEIVADGTENVDTRWLPWIGSWRLTSDTINEKADGAKDSYLLNIRPAGDGKSIIMKSSQAGEVLLEERIIVDGSRQPLKDGKCAGWYKYSWSDIGKRLLFESESGCPGEIPRVISGISIITGNRDWLDIQLLQSGEERALSVRKYEAVAGDLGTGEKTIPGAFGAPRYQAATTLSIDEVIELSHKVAPEVIEAALVELHQPFQINAKTLARLADAKVPSQIVDLMVALSYPDKFTVERHRIAPVQQFNSSRSEIIVAPPPVWLPFGYWSIYGPYSRWYWSSSIFYPYYGYWDAGWGIWLGGYHYGRHGGGSESSGGRLVNGRGYSRVSPSHSNSRPRYAQPRSNSRSNSGGSYHSVISSSPSPSTGTGSGISSSISGSSGSGSSSPSSSPAPSASPSGYHGGGASHTAKPRE
jgi:hypothetical protein